MCRNIKTLFNFDPPATDEEIRAASLQFVRKLSGFTSPSKVNEEAFDRAIEETAAVARRLIDSLSTTPHRAIARKWRRRPRRARLSASVRVSRPDALRHGRPEGLHYFLRKCRTTSGQNSSQRLPPMRVTKPIPLRTAVMVAVVWLGGSQAFSITLLSVFPA